MAYPEPVPSRELYRLVAIGGVIGAVARFLLSVVLPHGGTAWPWATFVANILGCLVIGYFATWLLQNLPPISVSAQAARIRAFVVTGVLGGFTTFSSFAVETHAMAAGGRRFMALLYVVLSMVIGLLAVWLGSRLVYRTPEALEEDEVTG